MSNQDPEPPIEDYVPENEIEAEPNHEDITPDGDPVRRRGDHDDS